jgi:hypothetical protein
MRTAFCWVITYLATNSEPWKSLRGKQGVYLIQDPITSMPVYVGRSNGAMVAISRWVWQIESGITRAATQPRSETSAPNAMTPSSRNLLAEFYSESDRGRTKDPARPRRSLLHPRIKAGGKHNRERSERYCYRPDAKSSRYVYGLTIFMQTSRKTPAFYHRSGGSPRNREFACTSARTSRAERLLAQESRQAKEKLERASLRWTSLSRQPRSGNTASSVAVI